MAEKKEVVADKQSKDKENNQNENKTKKVSKNKELFKLDIQNNIGFKDVLNGFLKIDKSKLKKNEH